MRRRIRRDTIAIDPDPNIPVSNVDRIPVAEAGHSPGSTDTPSNLPTGSSLDAVVEQLPHDTSASLNPPTITSSSLLPVSTLPLGRHISTVDHVNLTAPGPNSALDSALAVEEARFLRGLYDRNAPPNEIAELMQAMRGRREEVNSEMAASSRHARPEVEPSPLRLDGRG